MIASAIAWMALFAALFASVGLYVRTTGVPPLHFPAVASIAATSFVTMTDAGGSLALAGACALASASVAGALGLFAQATSWLRRHPAAQMVFLLALGTLMNQGLAAVAGYRFFSVSLPGIADASQTDTIASLIGAFVVAALLWFDRRSMARRLDAAFDNRRAAEMAGVNVARLVVIAIVATACALAAYSVSATLIRGHHLGIDTMNVILAATVATVWRARRVWAFALVGASFSLLRLVAGLVAGAQWQDLAAFTAAAVIVAVASLVSSQRRDEGARGDGIHNPLGGPV